MPEQQPTGPQDRRHPVDPALAEYMYRPDGHAPLLETLWATTVVEPAQGACPVLVMTGASGGVQVRSADWTPARGRRARAEAARRLPPLPSGHRDPDGPRTDAPDQADVWRLAAALAGDQDPDR